MTFHESTVVRILKDGWIKVRWDWTVFSPGSTSRVHETWIMDDNAPRPRRVTDYNYDDDIRINFHWRLLPQVQLNSYL